MVGASASVVDGERLGPAPGGDHRAVGQNPPRCSPPRWWPGFSPVGGPGVGQVDGAGPDLGVHRGGEALQRHGPQPPTAIPARRRPSCPVTLPAPTSSCRPPPPSRRTSPAPHRELDPPRRPRRCGRRRRRWRCRPGRWGGRADRDVDLWQPLPESVAVADLDHRPVGVLADGHVAGAVLDGDEADLDPIRRRPRGADPPRDCRPRGAGLRAAQV